MKWGYAPSFLCRFPCGLGDGEWLSTSKIEDICVYCAEFRIQL